MQHSLFIRSHCSFDAMKHAVLHVCARRRKQKRRWRNFIGHIHIGMHLNPSSPEVQLLCSIQGPDPDLLQCIYSRTSACRPGIGPVTVDFERLSFFFKRDLHLMSMSCHRGPRLWIIHMTNGFWQYNASINELPRSPSYTLWSHKGH